MTLKLLATLDKCKLSDRDAVHIIISTADALDNDVSKLIINRSTIQRDRIRFRENKTIELQKKFNLLEKESFVLHWDKKLLLDITYGELKVDRLPVIVSFEEITQLLGVPKLKSGTGEQQTNAIFDITNDCNVTNKVQTLCCDTMASNTGWLNGACIILKQLIGRNFFIFTL
jgi:adenylate/nucleoside-diphosphate kinase